MERHIDSGSWLRRIKRKDIQWWHRIEKMDPKLHRSIRRAQNKMRKRDGSA
jgi:hypothetical protein